MTVDDNVAELRRQLEASDESRRNWHGIAKRNKVHIDCLLEHVSNIKFVHDSLPTNASREEATKWYNHLGEAVDVAINSVLKELRERLDSEI